MMMSGKKCAAVALCLVLAAGLFAGGKKDSGGLTIVPGVLSVGQEIGYPPFEYYADDGKTPIGFDVEMCKAIAAKLGLTVKFIDTGFDGIFAGVTKGDYDCVVSAVTVTEARLAAHNFTKPYIGNAQCMVLAKNTKVTAKSPQELAGYGVAYQAETTSDYYMAKLADEGLKFTPYEYAQVLACFEELRLGRVDAIICDSTVASDFISKPNAPYEVVWQGPADEVFGICLKKGNDALTQAMDKALDELFADGTMLRLSRETFGGLDLVSAARK
jgi:polar amino acid transport system substrate-binding protein